MSRPWRPNIVSIVNTCVVCVALATSTAVAPVFSATPVLPTICDSTPTIIPGTAIGTLLLGMSLDDAQKLLPTLAPSETLRHSGTYQGEDWSDLRQPGIALIARGGRVVKINMDRGATHSVLTHCRTPEGVGLEMFRSGVEKAYGPADGVTFFNRTDFLIYNSRGLELRLVTSTDPADKGQEFVAEIAVFAPGSFCDLMAAGKALGFSAITCNDFSPPLK